MCKIETIRRALGVSMAQMAQAVGLSGINAADHLREMERGNKPVSGPMQIVLKYMQQSVEIDESAELADLTMRVLPRFLDCSNLADDGDGVEIIMHTRWPRFYGLLIDDIEAEDQAVLENGGVTVIEMDEQAGLGYLIVIFIDNPITDPGPVIAEAVRLKTEQAYRDLN